MGASLIIWAVCGGINLILALCYAELGSAIPIAGGDYAYVKFVLGPFPGFMCLWVMVVLLAPLNAAIVARIVGAYFVKLFGLEYLTALVVVVAIFTVGKKT